jgi:mannose-1-phosphate guanylyltransferase
MPQPKNQHHEEKERSLWGIILAGGNGSGPRDLTRLLYSDDRPKQFCAFTGKRSMVQHTLDRAESVIEPDKILTVVSGKHLPLVREQLKNSMERSIVVQPYCRDTAPEIFLPLSKIHHQDPRSVTVIFPSGHFVLDEWRFAKHVRNAAEFAGKHPEKIVLLGVRAESDDRGFGLIGKGNAVADDNATKLFHVRLFTETPQQENSEEYFWSTCIVIARTDTLMEQFRECLPDMYSAFAAYRMAAGKPEEWHAVNAAYDRMRPVNFSASVLERISSSLCVKDISDTGWSDWSDEHRIKEDALRYDLRLNAAAADSAEEKTDETYCLVDVKTEMKK